MEGRKKGRKECWKEGKKTKMREEEASVIDNVFFFGNVGTRLCYSNIFSLILENTIDKETNNMKFYE